MRRFVLAGLILCLLCGAGFGVDARGVRTARGGMGTPMGEYHLLVIGIDDYIKWPKLKCAVRDANSVRDILVAEYGFNTENVIELYNSSATEDGIISATRKLARELTAEDSLLIYYAGHGQLDDITGDGSWVPVDGDRRNDSRWIRCGTIKSYLRSIPARHILLISDSCFAGDFFRGSRGKPPEITDAYVRDAFKKSSRQAITSGGLEPVADAGFDGHSVFAHFLLKELKENKRPFLLPSDLHNRIKGGVSLNASQQAILGNLSGTGAEIGGEFVLFRKGAGGTMEALLKRKAEQIERLEAMEAEARKADARARELEQAKRAELDVLDKRIRDLEAKVDAGDTGGGKLKELLTLVRQQEKQAKDLEALKMQKAEEEAARRAEIARLKKAEVDRRKIAFHADLEDYHEIMNSNYARDAIKQKAWEAICKSWGVEIAEGSKPGVLRWNTAQDRAEMKDVGALVVRSKKAGKIRLDDGMWNELTTKGLRWGSLIAGQHKIEAVIDDKTWNKTVTVRDKQTTEVVVSFGPSNGQSITVDLGGGVSMELVWVEHGSFQMGSNDGDSDEYPVHSATLTKGGWMGKYEVTQRQWQAVMGSNPSSFKSSGLDAPVENVSWNDCQEFIKKVNAKVGSDVGTFRLPTEAEWEYAARGGSKGRGYKYSGGNSEGSVAWYSSNSGKKTHPVGQKHANELGLYDMSGNVWEWCHDWFGAYPSGSATDHRGAVSRSYRVLRGGSWLDSAGFIRVANRGRLGPSDTDCVLGLRLCLVR